ncbi:hypothetical protein [Streptomyces sp. bgisy031]|uniref:hypothetical protein n=1 Tax=Streptomyces sp. bgisy031 TaxID=3413772 RepID=UPI003D714888
MSQRRRPTPQKLLEDGFTTKFVRYCQELLGGCPQTELPADSAYCSGKCKRRRHGIKRKRHDIHGVMNVQFLTGPFGR